VNWWPLKCKGKAEAEGEYNFYFSTQYDWHGVVTDIKPNRIFFEKMTQSEPDWDETIVGFEMAEENGTTQLRFSHTNWQECNSHFRTSSFCWAMLLKGLKDYVEEGIILPFEKRS
jgi:hypothetical protein